MLRFDLRALLCAGLCLGLLAQAPSMSEPMFVDESTEDPTTPIDPMLTDPAALTASALKEQDSTGKTKRLDEVIGATWEEIRACTADTDCVLLNDFVGCCSERPVNIRYAALIEENRFVLHQRFTPAAELTRCVTTKCMPPRRVAKCQKEVCEAVRPPARLEKVEALNIAAALLINKLRTRDFGPPIFGFDPDKMLWMVDFGPMKSQHKKNIKELGVDTGYRVLIDDVTEQSEIRTYLIKQDILP